MCEEGVDVIIISTIRDKVGGMLGLCGLSVTPRALLIIISLHHLLHCHCLPAVNLLASVFP